MNQSALISRADGIFPSGFTSITQKGEPLLDTGMDFGVYVQTPTDQIEEAHPDETAWLLMHGKAQIEWSGKRETVERNSLFDEPPTVFHCGPNSRVSITALSPMVEWARIRTANLREFEAKLFSPHEIQKELRGKGMVHDTSLRNVRLVFDQKMREQSNLVLGEVINLPGRWSSYPPHHHFQPEIYHYRFSLPQGYGHAELGDQVFKVRSGDTLKIMNGLDHAQVSAPGYGMYYLWVIRHLPNQPYRGFEFSPEHQWILNSEHPFQKQMIELG